MKALLITRCGCSQLIDVPDTIGTVIERYLDPDYAPRGIEEGPPGPEVKAHERRMFTVTDRMRVFGHKEPIFVYKEVA